MRFALAAVAVISLAAFALPAARAQDSAAQGTLLTIVAEGHSDRTPDLATIEAGVVTQAPTAAEALRENSARMSQVRAALHAAGVADRDIRTATISLNAQYRTSDNKPPVVTGYEASNRVTIRFRDVAKAGTILDTLVREGANSIQGPSLSVDAPEAALDEARTAAIATARARAELYARAAGLRVDHIVSISEGGDADQPVVVTGYLHRVRANADTSIAPGEQTLSVTLSVRFLLK